MNKEKIIGENFLQPHPKIEYLLNIDEKHVIVDRKDWEMIVKFFEENPQYIQKL